MNERLYLIELFAGSQSVSKSLRKHSPSVRVLSLDNDPTTYPSIAHDINTWNYKSDIANFLSDSRKNDYIVVWASPPCTAFSFANTTGKRDLKGGSRNVKTALRIIRHVRPKFWFMENPVGLLKEMPFMQKYAKYRNTCSYCKYGTKYRKNSNIWSNVPELNLLKCVGDARCEHRKKHGVHAATAQKGPSGTRASWVPGSKSGKHVYAIPSRLVNYLFAKGAAYADLNLR